MLEPCARPAQEIVKGFERAVTPIAARFACLIEKALDIVVTLGQNPVEFRRRVVVERASQGAFFAEVCAHL